MSSSSASRSRSTVRRLSLTLPAPLFDDLEAARVEEGATYVAIISAALERWLELHKAKKMAAGYIAMNDQNDTMMDEFKAIDAELW